MRSMRAGWFRAPFAAALTAVTLVLAPVSSQAQVTVFKQSVAEAAAADADIAAFYRETDYAPLWIGSGEIYTARLTALMRAVSEAQVHGLPADRYTSARIEGIVASVQTERDRGRAEVELSALFLRYARDVQTGVLTPANVDPEIKREVPVRNRTAQLRGLRP